MKVKETNVAGLKREYQVVVPSADIEKRISARIVDLSKNAKLPGFRPGKVPQGLLRQRFEPSVRIEVLEDLVRESTNNIITENKLRPAVQPKIDVLSSKEGSDLEFGMNVEVMPEIEIKDFDGISIEKLVTEVPEDDVEKAIERIARSRRSTEKVEKERAAKKGDTVVIDFVGKLDGKAFEGGKGDNYYLELGSGTFIPGFEEQLEGKKVGDEAVVKVKFPEDYRANDLAGKDAAFDVTIKELREAKETTIDDDFAKSIGYDTIDEMKDMIRNRISSEYDMIAHSHLKRELLDKLSGQYDFVVPETMVEAEFNAIWQQYEQAKSQGQIDEEDASKSEEDLHKEYRNIAERRVRLGLLFAEIGNRNNIQVPDEKVKGAIFAEARRFPGQEKAVFDFYINNPRALEAVRAPLYEEMVVDYIVSKVKVADKKVTPDELYKFDNDDEGETKKSPSKSKAKTTKKAKEDKEDK